MPAVPLKSEYGPTLGELLSPRWRRAARAARAPLLAAALLLLLLLAAAVARFLPPTLSYSGSRSFSFSYSGLYRAPPPPGDSVLVRRPRAGRPQASFAVAPLLLAPYRGEPGAALALYATDYIRRLRGSYRGFALRGEGWTQVDSVSPYAVYNVFFTADLRGQPTYGREVLILPEHPGARAGVSISMLSRVGAEKQVTSPLLLGTKGALAAPLTSFALE